MQKARMNISHFRFILFNLKIFGEIVTTHLIISLANFLVGYLTIPLYFFGIKIF